MEKRWRNALIAFASIFCIIILALVTLNGNNNSSSIYYGPALSDAVYEEIANITITEEVSTYNFTVTSDWLGVRITILSESESTVYLIATNPDGVETISLEQKFEQGLIEVSETRSFNPDTSQGTICGEWTIKCNVENEPVTIVVDEVVFFGTP